MHVMRDPFRFAQPAPGAWVCARARSSRWATLWLCATRPGASSMDGQEIYSHPAIYEMAFSYRQIAEEVAFVRDVFQSARGREPRTLLDCGCGTGRHCVAAAQAGMQATGVDLNSDMVAHANDVAQSEGVEVVFHSGDMRSLDNLASSTFDVATIWLGTFMHLTDVDDAAKATASITRHLSPGGLLIVEVAHPGDLFDGSMTNPDVLGSDRWEQTGAGSAPGVKSLEVQWGSPTDDFDPTTQVLSRTVTIVARGERPLRLQSVVKQRHYTVGEFSLLAKLAGLRVLGLYGEADVKTGLYDDDAYRMIVVMERPLK